MKATAKEYAHAWYESLVKKNAKEQHAISRSFLRHLYENGQFSLLPDIVRAMSHLEAHASGIVRALVTTAHELDNETVTHIAHAVLGDTKTKIAHRVDAHLRGGFIVEVPGRKWNASVSGKLASLKKQLTS